MTALKEIITKRRQQRSADPRDILEYAMNEGVKNAIHNELKPRLEELYQEYEEDAEKMKVGFLEKVSKLEAEVAKEIKVRIIEIRGEKGDKGDKGDSIKGKPGEKGEPGDSIKGDKGEPGKNGSPDTPEQVVKKLNEGRTLIKRERIEGLDAFFDLVKKEIQKIGPRRNGGSGGGGGMGAFQSELKSVSSATTTITTTYKIAGNGQVLWLSYNGQALHRGTDYTVGTDGRTITLLFTPQDSTVIQVDYIRT